AEREIVARMYIDRAWIFLEERPDHNRAANDLDRAEAIIPADSPTLWCDLYNARAGLIGRSKSGVDALPFYLKALASAEVANDMERMTKMAYNVGQEYMFSDRFELGITYFEKSLHWATASGNKQAIGLAHKGLGGCAFFLDQLEKAIKHYQQAYLIWQAGGNENWLTNVCYDLVEAYATIGEFQEARHYFQIGTGLVQKLNHQRLLVEYETLAQQFPALTGQVNDRQARLLAYIDKNGSISRKQYMDLIGIGKSQAHRDLTQLCDEGVLVQVGVGRGTRYEKRVTGNP
ncbi:MAG: tetratricopeptide repeat protein, partial [Chloroflexota bacterium]